MSKSAIHLILPTLGLLAACQGGQDGAPSREQAVLEPASCMLDAEPVQITGEIAGGTEKSYFVVPVNIPPGTRRIEFLYGWSDSNPTPLTGTDPNDTTVLDLGWWDQRGYRDPAGFRGWGGSRQARLDRGDDPGFIEAGEADRGFTPGPIQPGTWYAEIGVAIASRGGAEYELQVACLSQGSTQSAPADPVDPKHVANPAAGWYHGDLHMHGYHSNPAGPDAFAMADLAREAELDVIFYTDYVVVQHWDEMGAAQRANPDLLFFPGREIITYSGHANTLGETRGVVEYRHGFEDITMGQIQADAVAAGALFQINHPTTFDIPGLENLCRGCQWDYEDGINWQQVHSMEVVTGPIITGSDQLGAGGLPLAIQNPFTRPALNIWHERLQQGHRITAVSGSDSKGTEAPDDRNNRGYGSSATAIYADTLSQQAVREALLAGRVFVKTLGVDESPHVDMQAETEDGQSASYGGELALPPDAQATLSLQIAGAAGQRALLYRNAQLQQVIPITGDPHGLTTTISRDPASEGPLGTWWSYEIISDELIFDGKLVAGSVITAIGNPVFLRAPDTADPTGR